MGRRGPTTTPTAIKLAKGERRPSRVNYAEPQMERPESLRAPAGLRGAGLQEWRSQAKQLADRGVLTDADLSAFEDYCRALSELRAYEAAARRAGCEAAQLKGYSGMVLKLRRQVNQLRQQCGLTPASRTNVRAKSGSNPIVTPKSEPASKYLRALPGGKADGARV